MDVILPDGSGFDFCEEIRNKTKAYILFLTAKATNEDVVRGMAGGGDAYITKPFHPEEMLVKVDAAIRRMDIDKSPVKNLSLGSLNSVFINDKTLRKHISEMRYKLDAGKCSHTVTTVYGKGYCFNIKD